MANEASNPSLNSRDLVALLLESRVRSRRALLKLRSATAASAWERRSDALVRLFRFEALARAAFERWARRPSLRRALRALLAPPQRDASITQWRAAAAALHAQRREANAAAVAHCAARTQRRALSPRTQH